MMISEICLLCMIKVETQYLFDIIPLLAYTLNEYIFIKKQSVNYLSSPRLNAIVSL